MYLRVFGLYFRVWRAMATLRRLVMWMPHIKFPLEARGK